MDTYIQNYLDGLEDPKQLVNNKNYVDKDFQKNYLKYFRLIHFL